jgi:hypothetical protein
VIALAALPAAVIAHPTSGQDGGRVVAGDVITVVACIVREADHARSTAPAAAASGETPLLLANAQSGTLTYSLTGVREQELAQHVGRRVEISGTVERPRTTPIVATADGSRSGVVNTEAPGATGITPDGAAAHEPSDALSATVQAGKVADPQRGVSDPAYRVATLPRLNVTVFRQVSGTCAGAGDRDGRTASDARAAAAAPRQVPAPPPLSQPSLTSRAAEAVIVRGCLVRRTPGGTALTPATDRLDPLALTDASIAGPPSTLPNGGAAGAGAAADRGTGTLPAPVATTGTAPQDAGRMTLALTVTADNQRQLSQLVGERVEVNGTLTDDQAGRTAGRSNAASEEGVNGRLESSPAAAHPSAPARTIRVTSFRPLGGACN